MSGKDEDVISLLKRVSLFFRPLDKSDGASVHLTRNGTRRALNGVLKSIVDGPMDADKLDYLRRDSLHSGVLFSNGIDLERFFESLRACVNTSKESVAWQPAIGVSEKGIAPAETIITARYHLFSIVYWHRTVRCITAILQRLLSEISLALPSDNWNIFIRKLINEFRRRDDRQALEWLKNELQAQGLLSKKLGSEPRLPNQHKSTAFEDIIVDLLGKHQGRFRMAFELSYIGPADPRSLQGKTAREELHDVLCSEIHPVKTDDSHAAVTSHGRKRAMEFREELEKLFNSAVSQRAGKEFELDTILLDVPEPGKDQIRGMIVDKRSKRSRRSGVREFEIVDKSDYVDIIAVSPIAATLSDVFMRWARKVRIFMTDDDLLRLRGLKFEAGDVAALWEHILLEKYKVDPSQPGMRF